MTNEGQRYEENINDKDRYQSEIKRIMIASNTHESFKVDIGDDSELHYAFTQVLKHIRKTASTEWRPVIHGCDMNDHCKMFNLNKESNLEEMIKFILGEITVETYSSDTDPGLIGFDYIPVRFVVKFINMVKSGNNTKFVKKVEGEYEEIESIDDFRKAF